ncbi:MAG: protein kinase [Chitinivibrionales bacterium]|nr:protein kinase [Chitinivibrionales bacterium]
MHSSQQNPYLEEGDLAGRYRILRLLGAGAMGRVFLAEDPILDRKIALKQIAVDTGAHPKANAEYLQRFTLEARASARLHHQSIVQVFDAGEHNGLPWIAFQYIAGESLEDLLNRETRLLLERALRIGLDIASALEHAHGIGIVHRDVKPANILLQKDSEIAMLSDFGIAKAPWATLTQEGSALGSPGYMSPEQIDGAKLDARSDLFSLGIVL